MSGRKLKITVLDITTNTIVVKDMLIKDAAAHLGVNYKALYTAVERGSIVSKKYKVVGHSNDTVAKKERNPEFDEYVFKVDWDKIRFFLNPKARTA